MGKMYKYTLWHWEPSVIFLVYILSHTQKHMCVVHYRVQSGTSKTYIHTRIVCVVILFYLYCSVRYIHTLSHTQNTVCADTTHPITICWFNNKIWIVCHIYIEFFFLRYDDMTARCKRDDIADTVASAGEKPGVLRTLYVNRLDGGWSRGDMTGI